MAVERREGLKKREVLLKEGNGVVECEGVERGDGEGVERGAGEGVERGVGVVERGEGVKEEEGVLERGRGCC